MLAALEHGLNVFVEKPTTLTGAEADRVLAAATANNRQAMVGFNRRFDGIWRSAKDALQDGALGQLRQVNLAYTLYKL